LLEEARQTMKLAVPLMIGQVSQMLLGVADALMVGKLGVTELAALTFVNSLFHLPLVFGIGLLSSVSVLTSNARGAGNSAAARASCRHGLYLSLLLGVVMFLGAWILSGYLGLFGQPIEVSAISKTYFLVLVASVVPALASISLKNHADAMDRPWPPFWIFLAGVVLNIGLNWVMIFGKLGCPALGMEGAAWATLISRWCIVFAMLGWLETNRALKEWVPYRWFRAPVSKDMRELLALGFPASVQMLFEVSAFSLAGLMMGRFGATAMAAHQIAITLAATAFMMPLGLSMALTVRVGEAFGSGEIRRLRRIALSGWGMALAYASAAAVVFILFGKVMSGWFSGESAVVNLSAQLLVIVGVFQIVDGLQVASSAMLRGLKDTRLPAVIGFISYWLIGIPCGLLLGLALGWDAAGVWWGLALGLLAASLLLGPRLWWRVR